MYKQLSRGVHGASIGVRDLDVARRTVKHAPMPRQQQKPKQRTIRVVFKPKARATGDPASFALQKSAAAKARLPQPRRQATAKVDPAAVALAKMRRARERFFGGVK